MELISLQRTYTFKHVDEANIFHEKLRTWSNQIDGSEVLPGFAWNSFWDIERDGDVFILSKPYPFLGINDLLSNYIAEIRLYENQALVKIRLKPFTMVVLFFHNLLVLFFILKAIFDGPGLVYIVFLFPPLTYYSLKKEHRFFIKQIDQLMREGELPQ